MKKENIVGFRISMWDVGNPQELWGKLKPRNCIDSAWIPQTIGDQIWMWFEFKNKSDKDEYIKNLNPLQYKLKNYGNESTRKIL